MTCTNCETREKTAWHGYTAACLQCAAALVISARPHKHLQEAQLLALTRRGVLKRGEILAAIKARG